VIACLFCGSFLPNDNLLHQLYISWRNKACCVAVFWQWLILHGILQSSWKMTSNINTPAIQAAESLNLSLTYNFWCHPSVRFNKETSCTNLGFTWSIELAIIMLLDPEVRLSETISSLELVFGDNLVMTLSRMKDQYVVSWRGCSDMAFAVFRNTFLWAYRCTLRAIICYLCVSSYWNRTSWGKMMMVLDLAEL